MRNARQILAAAENERVCFDLPSTIRYPERERQFVVNNRNVVVVLVIGKRVNFKFRRGWFRALASGFGSRL